MSFFQPKVCQQVELVIKLFRTALMLACRVMCHYVLQEKFKFMPTMFSD